VRTARAPAKSQVVAPGAHRPQAGDHCVVWWDPARLRLDARETMGLRQHRLLTADKGEREASQGAREYEQWKERHGATLAAGAKATYTVVAATELAQRMAERGERPGWLGDPERIAIERVARAAARPQGVRFGTLVHAVLSRVAVDADASAIAEAARFFARMLGADGLETAAACDAVAAALGSPLMKAATAAGARLRRECALTMRIEDGDTHGGLAVEGVVDLAFPEPIAGGGERWVVVDFKTDADIARRLDEYRLQLLLYLRAIGESTGAPARGVLMCV
jgi:ATP-dependent exoDNAse (exonuclease V) beta subunit